MHNIVIGLVTRHVSGSNGVVAERDDLKSLQYYRFLPIAKKKKDVSLYFKLYLLYARFHSKDSINWLWDCASCTLVL